MLDNKSEQFLIDLEKQTNKAIRDEFGDRIKESFLIKIKNLVKDKYGFSILYYFEGFLNHDSKVILKGNPDSLVEFEVCRNIVGIHRANTIFMDDNERSKLQNDSKYKDKLVEQVFEHIRLRLYAGKFARTYRIIGGDEFFFFPIPYKLFALSIKANEILVANKDIMFRNFYALLFNKGLSALCLLENNMYDAIYPICRGAIEIYIKLLVTKMNPQILQDYENFCKLDLLKGKTNKYSEEFNKRFDERKYTLEKSRLNFMHFGWVDGIDDYAEIVHNRYYCVYSLFEYVGNKNNSYKRKCEVLKYYYDFCHTFTHGTSGNAGVPLAHYFNIVIMLESTIEDTYRLLCQQLDMDTKIHDVDILKTLSADFDTFIDQYHKRSPENFNKYYKSFK